MKPRTVVLLIVVALFAGGAGVYFALGEPERPRGGFQTSTPPAPVRRTPNTSASYNRPSKPEPAESSEPQQ
jgi:hypothetical protein